MPWADKPGRPTSHTAWRAVIVILLLAVAGVWVVIPYLYSSNRSLIQHENEISCRIGVFFIGQPVPARAPRQSQDQFTVEIHRSIDFLKALESADCSPVRGATISRAQIDRQIGRLRSALP